MSAGEPENRGGRDPSEGPGHRLPVMFVLDRDPSSLNVVLTDLARRFGNDFAIEGDVSTAAALDVLRDLAAAGGEAAVERSHAA